MPKVIPFYLSILLLSSGWGGVWMRELLVVKQLFSAGPVKRFRLKSSDFLKLGIGSLLEPFIFSLVTSRLFYKNKILTTLIYIVNG